MGKIEKIKKDSKNYLLDHPHQKFIVDYLWAFVVTLISAFAFAYGFRAFVAPAVAEHLVSGGASGLTQVIVRIIERIAEAEIILRFCDNVTERKYGFLRCLIH